MAIALIDYIASMTNSEYQAAYNDSRTLLLSPRIGNSTSVAAFGDVEEQAFAIFDAYAQDARRSIIDCLDTIQKPPDRGFSLHISPHGVRLERCGLLYRVRTG